MTGGKKVQTNNDSPSFAAAAGEGWPAPPKPSEGEDGHGWLVLYH